MLKLNILFPTYRVPDLDPVAGEPQDGGGRHL